MLDIGQEIFQLCQRLYPICRSITGNGVRETLSILKEYLPELSIHEVPTGTQCFDWQIPKEWNINDAYVIDPNGNKIISFKQSNLHVVGYSTPVNQKITLEALQPHLFSLPEQPNAIPYITSYYKEQWGFCLTESQRKELTDGIYHVYIDSNLTNGSLTYGELIIPGETSEEIFLSTYICHPSMANNELSGPAVTTFLAQWIKALSNRKYTYRIIFIPETIGSIAYLSKNLAKMKKNIVAGFNITCVGDDRAYSYLPSRKGNTLADRAAIHTLNHQVECFDRYSFLDRGSDERQYCSPGIDLPICSVMRSKYGCYPEYHTSLDNLSLISKEGLHGGYNTIKHAILAIEINEKYVTSILCEPQMGRRDLYPTTSTKSLDLEVKNMMDTITYCDGEADLLEIADQLNLPIWDVDQICQTLLSHHIIKKKTDT
ncbi:aminopeptidase [Thalassotalea insulae]|uniref:Aminopeptidase n=1 Tax=Thalassotalea insulae TaxID=2056778 RepID=A0ABQ6GNT7_9GAMM|nr:DUF4910 domain-containing protein [Thalassotalea insulae]GLX77643.1 aminopeptidase [Thalassotalea insulae]